MGVDLQPLDYDARLACLTEQRIALWDVIAAGHRRGSLDAALRVVERSDLDWLARQLPGLRAVAFNGKLAARQAPDAIRLDRLTLPSSSPANTAPLAAKLAEWRTLGQYLLD